MAEYRLGLVSISFRKYEPEEILRAMQSAGLSCVEWGSDVHAPKDQIDRLQEIVNEEEAYCATLTEEEMEIYNEAAIEAGAELMKERY